MALKSRLAALALGASAVLSAHASPAPASPPKKPPEAPVPEPVHYHVMLVGLALVTAFGRRKTAHAETWSQT